MVLSYARYETYLSMKKIDSAAVSASEKREILNYLKRASRYIDKTCRRHFYPILDTHMYAIPNEYVDLARRLLTYWDLRLRDDLQESHDIKLHTGDFTDSTAVLSAAINFHTKSIGVDDTTVFSVGDPIRIDDESMVVRAIDAVGDTLTVVRGKFDTRAVSHADASTVNLYTMQALIAGTDYNLLHFNIVPKTMIQLNWPNTWAGTFVSLSGQSYYPSIFITGYWGYNPEYAESWVDTLEVVESGGIIATVTELNQADADALDEIGETRFSEGDMIQIDDELMWVTDIDTNVVTVLRGRSGSVAAIHTEGTPILRYAVPHDIQEMCLVIAKTWRDADDSVGGRQGVSEVSIGVELGIPKDVEQQIRGYIKPVM